jgi:hypothetical protein
MVKMKKISNIGTLEASFITASDIAGLFSPFVPVPADRFDIFNDRRDKLEFSAVASRRPSLQPRIPGAASIQDRRTFL